MLVRSVVDAESKIEEIMKLMKAGPDLDLVTSEGAVIQTNKFLMSQCSPFLKNLFAGEMSPPARLHLPEISAVPLRHLFNILETGYTTGQGTGDSVVKEIKIAAKVLGFEKFPVLMFIVGRNPTPISNENVQEFIERAPVQSDRIENGDDIIVELEGGQDNISQHPQDLEAREQSGLNTDDQPMVSIIQNIMRDMEIDTNEDGGTSQLSQEASTNAEKNKDCRFKVTGNIIYSSGESQSIRVRSLQTLMNPVDRQETGNIIYSSGNKRNKAARLINPQIPVHSQAAATSDRDTVSISISINETVDTNQMFSIDSRMYSNGNHEAPHSTNMETESAGTSGNKRKISSILPKTPQDDEIPMIEDFLRSGSGWMRMFNQTKKKCVVEVLDQTNYWSQEVTEITPIVLKVEPETEDQGNQTMIHCGVCRKAFSNSGSLLSHSVKHDEYIGKRSCTLCPFKGSRTVMLIHLRSKHTKEKLFHCPFCPKSFSSCSLKKFHQTRQHKAQIKNMKK